MHEVDLADGVASGAEAAGAGPGGLDQGGWALQKAVGDPGPEPPEDAASVLFDGPGEADPGSEVSPLGSAVSGVQKPLRLGGREFQEILEHQFHLVGLHRSSAVSAGVDGSRIVCRSF
jgi:hypothetical protein